MYFVFYQSDNHRQLHSFPTRRSSDLQSPPPSRGTSRTTRSGIHGPSSRPSRRSSPSASEKKRSEEHTSELQSRSDLVCRLLLEKKNSTSFSSRAAAEPGPSPRALSHP